MGEAIQQPQQQGVSMQQAVQMLLQQNGELMKQLDIVTIKLQSVQNAVITKGLICDDDIKAEWDKIITGIKDATKSNLVAPDGKPVASTNPLTTPVETPATTEPTTTN